MLRVTQNQHSSKIKSFKNRLDAINWIANHAETEGQFEVIREQLNFNYIYTNEFFISLNGPLKEVIILSNCKKG